MADRDKYGDEELLSPSEVALLFRVDAKTVGRWATAGKISSVRTLGGHRRYPLSEVQALRDGGGGAVPIRPLEDFTRWIAALGDATPQAAERRRTITLTEIVDRARRALGTTGEEVA